MSLSQLAYAYLLWQIPLTIAALFVHLLARRGTQSWQLKLARGTWFLALFAFPLCFLSSHLMPTHRGPETTLEPRGTAQIVETQIPNYLSAVTPQTPNRSQGQSLNGLEILAVLIAFLCAARALTVLRSELVLHGIYSRADRCRSFPGLDIRVSAEVAVPSATMIGLKRVILLDQHTLAHADIAKIAVVHEIQHHRQLDPLFAKFLAWASAILCSQSCHMEAFLKL